VGYHDGNMRREFGQLVQIKVCSVIYPTVVVWT